MSKAHRSPLTHSKCKLRSSSGRYCRPIGSVLEGIHQIFGHPCTNRNAWLLSDQQFVAKNFLLHKKGVSSGGAVWENDKAFDSLISLWPSDFAQLLVCCIDSRDVFMSNVLFDMQIKLNNQILAEDSHKPMYQASVISIAVWMLRSGQHSTSPPEFNHELKHMEEAPRMLIWSFQIVISVNHFLLRLD